VLALLSIVKLLKHNTLQAESAETWRQAVMT
jgi:hypothetical protein